jgi:predicted ester cyclase
VNPNGDLVEKANILDRIYASRRPEEIANKAIIGRYVEATNQGELDVFDDLVIPDYVDHDALPGQEPGRDGLKKAYKMFSDPFPDLNYRFDDLIAEGDLVVGRGVITATHEGLFFGVPATHKKVHWTGTRLFRLRGGKVVEGWINLDMMGLMQQMGVIPAPPGSDVVPPKPEPPVVTDSRPSTRDANRTLMRRFIDEVWNKRNLAVADEVFHPEASSPSAPQLPRGPEGVKMIARMFHSAFPDYHMDIDYLVAEDDRVFARFTQSGTHQGDLFGIPPTGKKVKFTEMGILRIAGGQVVESWYDVDMLGMMGQLGVGGQS